MLRRRPTKATAQASQEGSAVSPADLNYLHLGFARVPIFAACAPDELMRVAQVTRIRQHEPGDVVIQEGARGREFFVILEGEARVTRGDREVAVLKPGDFFGELALFDPAPRNATIIALTTLRVAVLTRPDFHDVLAEETIRDNILTGMARRLHELDSRV